MLGNAKIMLGNDEIACEFYAVFVNVTGNAGLVDIGSGVVK